MVDLTGRVAFVTGAGRGQGRSHAVALAQAGADIVGVDICRSIDTVPYALSNPDDLKETAAQVEALDRNFLLAEGDVRSSADLEAAVSRAVEEFGGIDILVANAGIWALASLWEMSEEQWQDMIDVNLTGVWRTLRAVIPTMIRQQRGSIILTASVNGLEAGAGYAHYVAAKHGVVGLMRNTALELGPYGIRCNAVCPGFIDTAMNDWQGAHDMMAGQPGGTSEDRRVGAFGWSAIAGQGMLPASAISEAVVWLASDSASRVTGVALPVDSGHMVLPGFNSNPLIDGPAKAASA
jgi:SDR family mycofactocin-dependent oxidoreductase